jgi:peptidoglycan/xylan/chitin deacetylase (PgdA/CDA1 family)
MFKRALHTCVLLATLIAAAAALPSTAWAVAHDVPGTPLASSPVTGTASGAGVSDVYRVYLVKDQTLFAAVSCVPEAGEESAAVTPRLFAPGTASVAATVSVVAEARPYETMPGSDATATCVACVAPATGMYFLGVGGAAGRDYTLTYGSPTQPAELLVSSPTVIDYAATATITATLKDAFTAQPLASMWTQLSATPVGVAASSVASAAYTNASGAVSFAVAPGVTTRYRLGFGGWLPAIGEAGHAGAAREITIAPHAYVQAPVVPATVMTNATFVVVGELRPRHVAGTYGAAIGVQRLDSSGTWVKVTGLMTNASNNGAYSRYGSKMSISVPGSYRMMATHLDVSHAKTSTGWTNFTVKSPKVVALTFDDGPWPGSTRQIVDILKKNGVTATFFMLGVQAKSRPSDARYVRDAGMAIANHSQSHPYMKPGTSLSVVRGQVNDANTNIFNATGVHPKYFRPPGGWICSPMATVMKEDKMTLVTWTVDPEDWKRPPASTIVSRVMSQVRPGGVVLMHDGGGDRANTVSALPEIIKRLKAAGYDFVTLDGIAKLPQTMG